MSWPRQVLVRLERIAAARPGRSYPHEQAVLAVEHDALHLALGGVVVDGVEGQLNRHTAGTVHGCLGGKNGK
jgi:hypothetical protein